MKGRHSLVLAAEVALALVTLAAVAGMGRLFDGGGWIGPLAVNAIAAHATAAVLRRRGLSLPIAGAAMVLAALLVVTWTSYWSTTVVGIPGGETWSAMQADLTSAWALYRDVQAPAPVETGFVLASALALWVIAYVADWAAFRLWVPFEATLPAGTLFLFTALLTLGLDRGRTWAIASYGLALLGFLLLHRMARQDGNSHWVAERRALGHRSLLISGGGLAIVAVLAGTVVGPYIPGADSPGVIDPRDLRGDSRVTVSPLIDIRSRLINQAATEVFTVRSPQRSYWRLTSLERFDGQIWTSSGTYGKADGPLPEAVSTDLRKETFEQTFTIEALAAIWLPNAYEPRALAVDGVPVRYDEDSATLIVDNAVETSDGLVYQVTSASPRLTTEELAALSGEVPTEIKERYLGLGADFSPRVRELAQTVTFDARTPAEEALALQDFLRGFTYSLQVQTGHSGAAIEQFLFETKKGYCEQFAGTFAAMARSIGLPARVAVGFTTGEADPADPQLFHVKGEHAHAWPEVYLAGAGWIAFEPTPGRGMPNAESYTGIPEQQTTGGNPTSATFAPSTTAPTIPGPGETALPRPDDQGDLNGGEPTPADDPKDTTNPLEVVVKPIRTIAPIVALVVLAYVLIFPLSLVLRRWRRRQRAETQQEQIDLAWLEAVERAALVGYREVVSDTFPERATHLASVLPGAEGAGATLAAQVEAASYSPAGADDDDVVLAIEASEAIRAAAWAVTPMKVRIASWLDPRAAVQRWRRERRTRQRHITMSARGDLEQERELVGTSERD